MPEQNIFHLPLKNSFDFFSAQNIAKIVNGENIHIIHAHLARDYPLAALAAYLSKKPFVLTRHLLFPLNPIHRLTLKRAAKIIAVSKGVSANLSSNKVIETEKIVVIYNGVDTNSFENSATDFEKRIIIRQRLAPDANILIGTIGELRQHKGQEDFIRAASLIAEKFSDAKFLLIGADNTTNQNFELYLKKLVNELNLNDRVIFTGWLENMPEVFAALDVFVSSARSEPFGLVIAEAMASAKPIVATETDGATELLDNNVNGKIVPIQEPVRLAEAVCEFLESEDLRLQFGENARKKARANFDLEIMITKTEQIYKEILDI